MMIQNARVNKNVYLLAQLYKYNDVKQLNTGGGNHAQIQLCGFTMTETIYITRSVGPGGEKLS